jgi:hypothetical protein
MNSKWTILLLWVLFSGCADLQPKETDTAAVQNREKAIVLIGLSTTWNGTPADPIKLFTGMTNSPLELGIARLDEETGLKRTRAFVLPEANDSDRRWIYLILTPGSYYLWTVPATMLERDLNFSLRDAGGFWLQVLPDQSVQYAGTLRYDLRGTQFLMEKFYKQWTVSLLDDRQAAAAIAQTAFSQYGGSPAVSLMHPYGQSRPLPNSLFPALIVTQSPQILQSPDWKSRAMEKAFGPVRFLTEDSSGYGAMGALGIALVYFPIGLGIGSSAGAGDFKTWQPCMETLTEEITRSLPDRQLRQRLSETLGGRAVIYESEQTAIADPAALAARHNCSSLLLADIQRIRLRECSGGRFCVETAVRVRLLDAQSGRYLFDQTVLYSNPKARPLANETEPAQQYLMLPLPFPQPYETVLTAMSPERKLEEYCDTDGRDIFAQEIDTAIHHAVTFFAEVYLFRTSE